MPDDSIVRVEPQNMDLQNSPLVDPENPTADATPSDHESTITVCYYNGTAYGVGAQICQAGRVFACNTGGVWLSAGRRC